MSKSDDEKAEAVFKAMLSHTYGYCPMCIEPTVWHVLEEAAPAPPPAAPHTPTRRDFYDSIFWSRVETAECSQCGLLYKDGQFSADGTILTPDNIKTIPKPPKRVRPGSQKITFGKF
jgi:hypothetical protein